jgi:UDP-N-acetylglucosamine 1-carboxyvinyltransferase
MLQTSKYIIEKSELKGSITISGAKNSVLRLLAASLLSPEKIIIENYPCTLLDAQIHVEMLEYLGKKCTVRNNTIVIEEKNFPCSELKWSKRSIRNTLLILGCLTTRTGFGKVPLPGGCQLDRKYDLHVMLLEKFGASVYQENDMLYTEAPKGLCGTDIYLPIRSTGATENAILCGTLATGKTTVWNPHIRPEILDLIDMLRKMGAEIIVNGQESIEIKGRKELSGVKHTVIPDNMEAMTWLIAAVITHGEVELHYFPHKHLEIPLIFLRASGAIYYQNDDTIIVRGGRCYPVEISTGPYPGINSDMQPLFAVYGACAKGESRIVDLRFSGRYGYIPYASNIL